MVNGDTKWGQSLLSQFESVFEGMYRAIESKCNMELLTLELLGHYESAKANAGVTLSSKIFKKREETTDAEWKAIKDSLGYEYK